MIYSIAFSLAFLLSGVTEAFAHKGEPRLRYKRLVVQKPTHHVVYHRPAMVRAGYVWVDGHYRWQKRTRSYVWIDGRYVKQKRGKVWISGQWVRVRGGWVYRPGSWRVTARF